MKTTDVWEADGLKYTFTWLRTDHPEVHLPYFQVYGICFNDRDEILIQRNDNKSSWALPGGTPENGETAEETLRREFVEEADTEVGRCIPLGTQLVEVPGNTNREQGDRFYQQRYVCLSPTLLEQTPDPDNGLIHERKFVPMTEINEYLKWGKSGEAMFRDAIELIQIC